MGLSNLDVILWAVVAALAFVGEVVSVSFFLLFFALGGTVAFVLALADFGVVWQIAGFIAASLASMAVLRPALMNRISLRNSERYEGKASITGRSGVVTEAIEPGGSGTVRIGSGEYWTARAAYPDREIEEGSRVRVLDSDGITALVEVLEERGEVS